MYNWEAGGKKKGKKAKKTGTVVLHPDDHVDLSFERLCKEQHPIESASEGLESPVVLDDQLEAAKAARKKVPLMTEATAHVLQKKMGFTELLPSQAQCYRGIFKGRDVILHSRTGSGKTLAYALPMVERHLILGSPRSDAGPFALVFVFSDELAFQTRSVLQKVYKKLSIGIAGMDQMSGTKHDIIIGTVAAIDEAVRGQKAIVKGPKRGREEEGGNESSGEASDSDEDDEEGPVSSAVNVSNVRVIVVDEVDTTLGPRFSNTGRRMRNLLKTIRRANGSLSASLMSDFHAHHYVLCGATIPNWVLKASFLGEKKYYYQLVTVGAEKLPPQLEVYATGCKASNRVERAVSILREHNFGRVVVFGTVKEMSTLEEALKAIPPDSAPAKKGKATRHSTVVRSLLPRHDEADRIAAMEDFNSKAANVMLCTDIAARGLDFTDVDTVLMLSLPSHNMASEVFVHRAGRTARVGKPGRCIVLNAECDAIVLGAVAKTTHVMFKKLAALEGGVSPNDAKAGTKPVVMFQLKVKSAFKRDGATITPEKVLQDNLSEAEQQLIQDLVHPDGSHELVRFSFPMESSHLISAKLWKYDVREVKA